MINTFHIHVYTAGTSFYGSGGLVEMSGRVWSDIFPSMKRVRRCAMRLAVQARMWNLFLFKESEYG